MTGILKIHVTFITNHLLLKLEREAAGSETPDLVIFRCLVIYYRHSNRHAAPKGSARCVQIFDDSLDFAIRITYRISLRSSSLWEPRHPLLKVLVGFFFYFIG